MARAVEGVARAAYRIVMGAAGALVEVASRVPGAPPSWRGLRDRLGHLDAEQRAMVRGAPALWFHAASVGELTAARPLLATLRERMPGRLLVVSTVTRTGLALARQMADVHLAVLFPIDAPVPVRRLSREIALEAFFFTETEIWPTWLEEMHARGVPAIMVSGRISERTVGRARWLRPLFRPVLRDVTCSMQSVEDAERVARLGAEPTRIHVAGSLKSDGTRTELPATVRALSRWLDSTGRSLVVAGSTHHGEDEPVVQAYAHVARRHPEVALLLAPRHPERFDAVAALTRAQGLPLVLLSRLEASPPAARGPAVVLLDEIGPLAACYGLAVAAFIGGSLVPVGGHNVLEAAAVGTPVIVGPHTANAAEVTQRLIDAGGAVRVGSSDALEKALDHLISEPTVRRGMAERARAAAQVGQGAVGRHLKIITARLSMARVVRGPQP